MHLDKITHRGWANGPGSQTAQTQPPIYTARAEPWIGNPADVTTAAMCPRCLSHFLLWPQTSSPLDHRDAQGPRIHVRVPHAVAWHQHGSVTVSSGKNEFRALKALCVTYFTCTRGELLVVLHIRIVLMQIYIGASDHNSRQKALIMHIVNE